MRRYGEFRYAARSWRVERRVIGRIAASAQGSDSRFIIRLRLLREWVAGGGALMMTGGYYSFQGIDAGARYHKTPVDPTTTGSRCRKASQPSWSSPTTRSGLNPFVAGTLGGLLTTWVTFVPCFLWIFLGAPFVETIRGNRTLAAALAVITAAVVGVILNLAVWFGLHVLFGEVHEVEGFGMSLEIPVIAIDPAALALTLAAIVAVFHFRIGMIPVPAACSAAGVLYFLVVGAVA